MWIKKITSSLYISLLLQMLFSTLISLGVFLSLIAFLDSYEQNKNQQIFEHQKDEILYLVDKIQEKIYEDRLTIQEANRKDFEDGYSYKIEFFDLNDDDLARYNYYKNRNYIFNASFDDGEGFIVFESKTLGFPIDFYNILAGIFSLLLFFALSLRIIFNLVSYIKTIEKGIKKMPENASSNIPVQGKNELARLAQSVNEINKELHEQKEKEKAVELNQRMLITNISHDLRTPLTSIVGYLDLAKTKITKENEAYSYLEIAEKSGLRLKKLIADLFFYSKIISEDIKNKPQSINIITLLNQIIELKTVNINFETKLKESILSIDIENFHRIIDNLLDNAIKYRKQDTEIFLSAYENTEDIYIEIKNYTDIDLSTNIDSLTNRLYIADEHRKDSSSGLGLSIVAELLKRMEGALEISYDEHAKIFIVKLILKK